LNFSDISRSACTQALDFTVIDPAPTRHAADELALAFVAGYLLPQDVRRRCQEERAKHAAHVQAADSRTFSFLPLGAWVLGAWGPAIMDLFDMLWLWEGGADPEGREQRRRGMAGYPASATSIGVPKSRSR